MGWEAAGTIIALVALIVTFVSAIVKLNNTITRLTCVVDNLAKEYDGILIKSHESHEKMYDKLEKHEQSITVLETKE